MGTRTTVNGQTVVHKDSGGVLNTTDVCKTQVGNAVVPIPYSNVAKSEDTSKGSKNVFFDGNPIMLKDSEFSKSTGDEPGNQKGIMSGTTGDIAKFTNYSFDVTVEGQNVCRRLDTMTSNNQNTPPGTLQQENLDGGEDAEKEEKIIQAKITKVSFDSPIKVAFDKKTINAPHWQEGSDDTSNIEGYGICSKKPAAYSVADAKKSDCKVTVNVNVTKLENISGKATLIGHLGGLKMQGELDLTGAKKYENIKLKIKNPPDSVQWYRGKISWQLTLQDESETRALNSTFGEVFFILDKPADFYMAGADKKAIGVWAEVLRFLCKKAGVVNAKNDKTAAEGITRYCHGKHGLKYEIIDGAPVYGGRNAATGDPGKLGGTGGSFYLRDYMERKYVKANCFDQGAAIQALCGAVGIHLKWIFMEPFGFIKKTHLLGYAGECNNPFFKTESDKKLGINDPKRKPFGCHVFCDLVSQDNDPVDAEGNRLGSIYDACAGPYAGGSKEKYVMDCVDTETTLYNNYFGFRAGTVADMEYYPGLKGVE